MNKQEKYIKDIIEVDSPEEIIWEFLDQTYVTDGTVGLIANKELVEYIMNETIASDWMNVRKIDLDQDDVEYMVSVSANGDIIVQPVSYCDTYFYGIEFAFVSMDGDVSQDTIDTLLNRDVPVVLFGCAEDENECNCDERCGCCESDNDQHGFTISSSDINGSYSFSFYSTDKNLVAEMAKKFK